MAAEDLITEPRDVAGFDQVILRDDSCAAELTISQGEAEGLRVEARADMLRRIDTRVHEGRLVIRTSGTWLERLADKLSTSLTRVGTVYDLKVRELRALDLGCASTVYVPSLRVDSLSVRVVGATRVVIENLVARELIVEHSGVGAFEVGGEVERQEVTLNGVGMYSAAGLRTRVCVVRISGPAHARVHVGEELDAVVRGIGGVEYSGTPLVRQRITGMGNILRVQ